MKRKVIIRRVESVIRSGTSKSGNPYSLDQTNVTIELPVDTTTQFGLKEVTYQYKDGAAIKEFEHLKDKIPFDAEIELDIRMNDYGSEETYIKEVFLPSPKVVNNAKSN